MFTEQLCGGCCQDVLIPLTIAEYDRLFTAGTDFDTILNPPKENEPGWDNPKNQRVIYKEIMQAQTFGDTATVNTLFNAAKIAPRMNGREGLFRIKGRCALLGVFNECTAYEERPKVCREFKQGADGCTTILENNELPTAEVAVEISARTPVRL